MISKCKWEKTIIILFLLSVEISFTQKMNPTVYPYGGMLDSSRYSDWMKKKNIRVPLHFTKANFSSARFNSQANFSRARFDCEADFLYSQFQSMAVFHNTIFDSLVEFEGAEFDNLADFRGAQFNSRVYLRLVQFNSRADFRGAQFNNLVYFWESEFHSRADFRQTQFDNKADFNYAIFDSLVDFEGAQFHSWANFEKVQFNGPVNFKEVQFDSLVDFRGVQFNSGADFQDVQFNNRVNFMGTQFNSRVNFRGAQFDNLADFRHVQFDNLVDFRGARIDSIVDFSLAEIKDTVFVGTENSSEIQRYNFKRAVLLPESKQIITTETIRGIHEKMLKYSGTNIILYGSVDLKIQLEKFEFIQLCDTLNYYAKKDIISTLKDISFKEDKYKKERFELDYIFAKSTMYQKELPYYEKYSISNPIYWGQFIYYITMGLGYRPFRMAYWALGTIIIFAILYFIKIREQINNYIFKDEKVELSRLKQKKVTKSHRNISNAETIINCLYFSTMLLFTFRLKKDILTFFEMKEKHFIVTEWVLGIIIFIAFLMLAKAGSILHTLKSLLIG